jgi:hypothetical protein
MTHRIEPWPNPIAASSSTLDCELAQQLEALADEEDSVHATGTRGLAPALRASAAWAVVALAAWLVVAWVL